MIAGSVAGLIALVLLGAAITGFSFATERDASGYVSTDTTTYATGTYAFVSDSYRADGAGDLLLPTDVLGKIRIRSKSVKPVFIGVGPAAAVDAYLGDVAREEVSAFNTHRADALLLRGHAPEAAPAVQRFWAATARGTGALSLTWAPRNGEWKIVLMNADGSQGVNADLTIGAEFPHLVAIAFGVLGVGVIFGAIAAVTVTKGVRKRH